MPNSATTPPKLTPMRQALRLILIAVASLVFALSLGLALAMLFPDFFSGIGERLGDGF